MTSEIGSHFWRLIVSGPSDAATNMARDEAILLCAAASNGRARGASATLRFYAWRPWAFSLGYFQKYEEFAAHAESGIPVVRRMTGGGAIYHADEITYSLVGPAGRCGFPRRAADIFEKVHAAIAGGLSSIGIDAELSDEPTGRSAPVCFERPQKYDIVAGGRKLLGSAQRRHGGHFLQHGSLPLSANAFAPGATSVGQLVAKRPPDSTIIDSLADALADSFGVVFVEGRLSDEEEAEAGRLAARKYASAEWNRKR